MDSRKQGQPPFSPKQPVDRHQTGLHFIATKRKTCRHKIQPHHRSINVPLSTLSSRTGDLHGAKRFRSFLHPHPHPLGEGLIFMARCKWPGREMRRGFKCLSVFNVCVSGSVKSVFRGRPPSLFLACGLASESRTRVSPDLRARKASEGVMTKPFFFSGLVLSLFVIAIYFFLLCVCVLCRFSNVQTHKVGNINMQWARFAIQIKLPFRS